VPFRVPESLGKWRAQRAIPVSQSRREPDGNAGTSDGAPTSRRHEEVGHWVRVSSSGRASGRHPWGMTKLRTL
jgi:hypothetical protein